LPVLGSMIATLEAAFARLLPGTCTRLSPE
jgi:hypothetical protein